MAIQKNEIGIIGLGTIGGNLAHQALEKNIHVIGMDKAEINDDLLQAGLIVANDYPSLARELSRPRKVFLYVPAGPTVDLIIANLLGVLEAGDIIVDGGNSYWRDSTLRYERLQKSGIRFVDMGTSGGFSGARNGACFMAGGDEEAVAHIEPILRTLSVEGGFVYTGPHGTGHFTKLVHNGIEFGMMQAIGEGLDLLTRSDSEINIAEVLKAWQNGSVIRSWLIDLMAEGFQKFDQMEEIKGYVEDTGEVNWLVEDAVRMQVPIPVIAQSVWQLMTSRDDLRTWAKAIAIMRHGFGGHPFGKNEAIALGRTSNRLNLPQMPL